MADEFQLGSGSWWDTSSRDRFESGGTPPTSTVSTTLNAIATFGWPSEMVDMKSRSSMNSSTASSSVLQGGRDSQPSAGGGGGDGVLSNPNLHTKGLGLSSQSMDWDQTLLNGKGESSFRSLLQEDLSSNGGFQPESDAYNLLLSENQQHSNFQSQPILNYPYPSAAYDRSRWTNSIPFWNAPPPPAAMSNARSSFFRQLETDQTPLDAKAKNKAEERDLIGVTKKNSTEKRSRSETAASCLPAFKVRKEKMGDRITALQQLVSPFGKTDTASVLSEAIDYIKFLHEQVSALSAPYMKIGAAMQNQQNHDESEDGEVPGEDLRSRGLCLVPVSSTFPVHETAVDFWTPAFGFKVDEREAKEIREDTIFEREEY